MPVGIVGIENDSEQSFCRKCGPALSSVRRALEGHVDQAITILSNEQSAALDSHSTRHPNYRRLDWVQQRWQCSHPPNHYADILCSARTKVPTSCLSLESQS